MKTTQIALYSALLTVTLVCSGLVVQAQTLGTVSATSSVSCPSGFDTSMNCVSGTISCSNTEDITFTYGYETPAVTTVLGTIVLLSGSGGQQPNPEQERGFANYYYGLGFQAVQLEWDSAPWEDATSGLSGSGVPTPNIAAAACRPATFLNYVYTTLLTPIRQNNNSTAGMCAQGFSGGSGAVAYSLAWYGASSYMDKVELLSGPTFSDIKQGCEVPAAANQNVCGSTPSWCQLGISGTSQYQAPWNEPPAYVGDPMLAMRTLTGDSSCRGNTTTTSTSNANWLSMSIVNGNSNPPVFSYPHTVVTGFSCAPESDGTMNNSASQAWIFFQQVSASSLAFYPVQNCPDVEGVYGTGATVPGLNGASGLTAVEKDMGLPTSTTGQCFKYH